MWACTERQSKGKTVGWKRKDRNVIKKIINKSKPLRTLGFSLIQRGRTIKQKVKKNRAVWACDIYVNNEKKKVHTTHWCKSYDLEIIIVIRVIIRDISLFISLHYSYFFFFPFLPMIAVIHWQFDKFPHLLRYLQILYTRFHPIFAKCSFSSNHKERYKIQVKPAEHLTIHYLETVRSCCLFCIELEDHRSSISGIINKTCQQFFFGEGRRGLERAWSFKI